MVRGAKKWEVNIDRDATEFDAGYYRSCWRRHEMKLRSCLLMSNPVECCPPTLQLKRTFIQLKQIDV